jgi:hypothetical protein
MGASIVSSSAGAAANDEAGRVIAIALTRPNDIAKRRFMDGGSKVSSFQVAEREVIRELAAVVIAHGSRKASVVLVPVIHDRASKKHKLARFDILAFIFYCLTFDLMLYAATSSPEMQFKQHPSRLSH